MTPKKPTEVLGEWTEKLLLPPTAVESDHCCLYSFSKSAKIYGGDWWGWAEISRKGKPPLVVMMIGDATGHGMAAALLAATVRGALTLAVEWAKKEPGLASDPREFLRLLNHVVTDSAQGAMMMTLSIVVYDPALGVIRTSNAGHCFPYVLEPDGANSLELKSLGGGGIPLGHARDTDYQDIDTYTWVKGSKLFLYTDGLIDSYKGEKNLFDRRALQRVLRRAGPTDGHELLTRVLGERKKLMGRHREADDLTVVVAELF